MNFFYILIYFILLTVSWLFIKKNHFLIQLLTGSLFVLFSYFNFNIYSIIILIVMYLMLSLISFQESKTLIYKNIIFVLPLIYFIYKSEFNNFFNLNKNLEFYNNIFIPIISMVIFFNLSIIIIYTLGTNNND